MRLILAPLAAIGLVAAGPASADPWWGRHGKPHRGWGPPPNVVVIPGYGPPPPVLVVPSRRPPPVVVIPPGAYAYPAWRPHPAYRPHHVVPHAPYGHFSFGLSVPFGR